MKGKALLAAAVAAALFIASIAPAGAAASAVTEPCADVTLVFARGSGQGLDEREAPKYFQSIEDRLGSGIDVNHYELGTEAIDGSKYKAVGVGGSLQSYKNLLEADASWTGFLGGRYRASVAEGEKEFDSYLSQRASRCQDEVFAVGGYSQGAQVVGEALFGLSSSVRSRIAFVSLFGDPKLYLPEGRGPFPPACRGKQFSPWRRGSVSCWTDNGVLEARVPYLPSDIEHRTGSWCDRNDFICNGNLADKVHSDHGQYADDGAEMDEAAREVALALRDALPDKADQIDVSIFVFGVGTAGVDVAFVIDTTGSMSSSIGAALAIAESAGETIVDSRGRVALTEYRDAGDPIVSQIVTPLTTDIDSFRSGLGTLYASGGGDTPEALLYAMMTTLNGLDWKPGATKAAVVLTDAGYHDPDLAGGFTLADVVQRSLEIDPVNVFPVVPSYEQFDYESLAEETSGKVIVDEGDTEAALLSAVDEIESRPVALLSLADYIAAPGEEIDFDASASYDPDSELTSFEWDFDGDGVIDEITPEPHASHTYADPYEGLVEVRVHSADGGVANAVANVRVDEEGLTAMALHAPDGLAAGSQPEAGSTRTVHLQWQPHDEGEEVDGWLVRDEAGELLAKPGGEVRSLDISGVPETPSTFSVAALNEFGAGPSAGITVPPDGREGGVVVAPPPGSPPASPPRSPAVSNSTSAARLLRLMLSRKRFPAAPRGGTIVKSKLRGFGTTLVLDLSAPAAVPFAIRRGKRVVGGFTVQAQTGTNKLGFSGRLKGRGLVPGTYFLVASLNGSTLQSRFTVVDPNRRAGNRR